MQPPQNADLHETTSSVAWRDENGIICSISKKAPPATIEQSKKDLEAFQKKFGEGKFCMLLDITNASPSTKESRDYGAAVLENMVTAIALISTSAMGRMMVNLYFGLKPPSFPSKIFSNELEAKEWLKKYL